MAEIPVERKGGIPWWAWLLLALVAAALLIWAFTGDDDDVAGLPEERAVLAEQGVVGGGPITSVAGIMLADHAGLIGKEVALQDVRVQEVVSDRGFFEGPTREESVFVVLDQVPTPTTPTEGRYDVTAGQTIDVNGYVRAADDVRFATVQGMPADAEVVVHAQSLDIL